MLAVGVCLRLVSTAINLSGSSGCEEKNRYEKDCNPCTASGRGRKMLIRRELNGKWYWHGPPMLQPPTEAPSQFILLRFILFSKDSSPQSHSNSEISRSIPTFSTTTLRPPAFFATCGNVTLFAGQETIEDNRSTLAFANRGTRLGGVLHWPDCVQHNLASRRIVLHCEQYDQTVRVAKSLPIH